MKRTASRGALARRRLVLGFAVLALLVSAAIGVRPPAEPAQPAPLHTVWLYLDTIAARSTLPPPLSEAALARRRRQGIPLGDTDRPIAPALVDRIRATGVEVRVESRWLRAVSVRATPGQLVALQRMPFVRRIEPVGRMTAAGGPRSAAPRPLAALQAPLAWTEREANDSAFYGVNYRIMAALGIPLVHDPEVGLTGQGVGIAILDTGFEPQHEALMNRIVGAQYDFINDDASVANEVGEDQERHGTWVWSLLGGFAPGLIVGPAYNATFFLAKVDVEPNDTRADEDRWVAAAEWAEEVGANIINSSVFFRDFTDRPKIQFQELDGETTATTRAAAAAARSGILVVQAIGNALRTDPSLAAPADAEGIISVGAVDFDDRPLDMGVLTSARGPTADARHKPELVAPAENVAAANSVNRIGLSFGLVGTSFATPLIAGTAALVMEAWPGLDPQAVRRALQLSASHVNQPENDSVGYGRPNVGAAIMMPLGLATRAITPADISGDPISLAPAFTWDAPITYPGMRPIRYTLEVATDSLIQDVIATDTVSDAQSLVHRTAFQPGLKLWWRVTARSRNGIERQTDVAGPFTVPHWVTLLTLAGDQPTFSETTQPVLAWEALPAPDPIGPLTYDVEVLNHGTGEVVQRVARGLTAPTVTVSTPLTPNSPSYRWRVIAHSKLGHVDTVTSVHPFVVNSSEAPPATILFQNFPNPFPNFDFGGSSTRIWFDLAEAATVQLTVHDLRGRLLRSLIPAQPTCGAQRLEPGRYGRQESTNHDPGCIVTSWDGRDQDGERLPRGIYVLRLLVNGKPEYRRMLYQPN